MNDTDAPDASLPRRPGIWELAWPTMLTNLLFSVVGIVTTIVVGRLGAEAVAAAGIGQQIFFGLQALLMAVSAGTSALVARAWGAGDPDEAVRVTIASLCLAGGVAIVVAIPTMVFAEPLASVFGLEANATAMAGDYIRWLSAFNLFFAIGFILNAALRAAGDARTPLWIGVGTNVVNGALIYPLVFGLGPLPALGLTGAAIAGGISFALASTAFLMLWAGGWLVLPFKATQWLERARIVRLVDVGYPALLEQLVFRLGFFIFFIIIGSYYGAKAFAAYSIGTNVLSVCFVVGFAFSIAGSTLVGQHLGANDPDGAERAGWRALQLAIASMATIGVAVFFSAEPLARLMIDDDVVVAHAVTFIYILGAVMPLMAIEFALGGSLRGAGDTRFPLYATIVGLLGMRCTAAALATWLGADVEWVYAALIGDYLVKGVMMVWRFRSGRWKTVLSTGATEVRDA